METPAFLQGMSFTETTPAGTYILSATILNNSYQDMMVVLGTRR